MSSLFGQSSRRFDAFDQDRIEYLTVQTEMRRILSFCGFSIDDLVNNPMVKREVAHWYRISRWMRRRTEISELERQWNPLR